MLIDTGATLSIMSEIQAKYLGLKIKKLQINVNVSTATQTPLEIAGYVEVELQIKEFKNRQKFLVGKGLNENVILGLDFLTESECTINISKRELTFNKW